MGNSSSGDAAVLAAFNLTKQVSSPEGSLTILDDVSFSVAPGESIAIVGASGAGKSTLLSLLAGLDVPTRGHVVLNGQDLGKLDEDGRAIVRAESVGFVYIEDRKKDMILVSGFNVYPNEVENVVVEMDGILEAAAIGVPDPRSGEIVKVFAVRTNDAITEQMVLDHCRENLTGYKRPKHVEFREELPKTNVGKILRRELRDEEIDRQKAAATSP